MKKIILLLSFTLLCFSLQAKKIKYERSLEKAQAQALSQQKPLAILVSVTLPFNLPSYKDCLSNELVIAKLNDNFINYQVDREDATASEIIKKYKISRFPSYIILDYKGGLIFNELVLLGTPQPLLNLLDKALAAKIGKSLVDYESEYNDGNESKTFLKEYILNRSRVGIKDNAALIEKYVNTLMVADLDNYKEVLFILKSGPILDGNAYKLARLNRYLYDSIYKTEPLSERVSINSAIISNSMRSAIEDKNINRATQVSNYSYNTWRSTDRIKGRKNKQLKMIQYYIGVKDTANYLQQTADFYDRYYMNISVDSARRKEPARFEDAAKIKDIINNLEEVTKLRYKDTTMIIKDTTRIIKRSRFSYSSNSYATALNNAAYKFYEMAGNQSNYLLKALAWSRRSIELSSNPAFYDTYAHILYKLKFYDEAERMEKKAIEIGKSNMVNTSLYKTEYKKIKKRTL